MPDIFLSYSRTDRDRVEPIAALLEAQGWSVWWDLHIYAGEQWDEVIEREVGAAKCVVAVWSSGSVCSRWVRAEAAEGLEGGKLVPVLIDATKPPLEFRRVHAIDLTCWKGGADESCARALVGAVGKFLGYACGDRRYAPAAVGNRQAAAASAGLVAAKAETFRPAGRRPIGPGLRCRGRRAMQGRPGRGPRDWWSG